MLRKELLDSHSSLTSERRAETRRSRDFSFGKRVATRVRRLIFLLSLSRLLEVRSFFRWGSGRAKTVRLSGTLASSQSARFGADYLYLAAMVLSWC